MIVSIDGVDPTGQSDSTAALQAHIETGARTLPISGRVRTGALTFLPGQPCRIEIDGELLLSDSLVLPGGVDVVGLGGYTGGPFAVGQKGVIKPAAGKHGLVVRGTDGCLIRDIVIQDCTEVGILLDGDAGVLSALCHLDGVSVFALPGASSAVPLRISSFFWVLAQRCTFISRPGCYPASIDILTDDRSPWNGEYSGYIRVIDTIINTHGIVLDNRSSSHIQPVLEFRRIDYENGEADFLEIRSGFGAYTTDIKIANITMPDAVNDIYLLKSTGRVRGVDISGQTNAGNIVNPESDQIEHLSIDHARQFAYVSGMQPVPALVAKDADISFGGRSASQDGIGASWSPVAQLSLIEQSDLGASIVPATAPDGTLTAKAVEGPEGSAILVYNEQREMAAGDWLMAGGWIRGLSTDLPVPSPLLALDASAGCELDRSGAAYKYLLDDDDEFAQLDGVWRRYSFAFKVTTVGATAPYLRYRFRRAPGHSVCAYWSPWLVHVRVSDSIPEHQIIKWAKSRGFGPACPGTVSLLPHQALVTGRGALPPDAASVGVGGQWYDTNLGRPLWSDGLVWRTACGVAVQAPAS